MFFPKKQKPTPAPKPAPPSKPKPFFGPQGSIYRKDFLKQTSKSSFGGPAGGYPSFQRKKMIGEAFPQKRFGTHISRMEAGKRLRELRREEHQAKSWADKTRIARLRKHLEKETGLGGQY